MCQSEGAEALSQMTKYALDNAWDRAKRRLTLLEQHLDPITKRRLLMLGVGRGWSVLEVGAGGGSIARWLCRQVGNEGHVTATDIDIRFLQEIDEQNFEAITHDIVTDELPIGKFDLVHTRWLLHHLPQPERAIERMIGALRPGGSLLLEEVDFFPVQTSTSLLYVDFMLALTSTIVAASGRDCLWARALPALVSERGLAEVGGEGDLALLHGGSPIAEFFRLTGEQMRDRVISAGALSAERFKAALALLDDPKFWAFAGAGIAVWGKRPNGN
jgi:2-polyprenyl-3-methyl-5-hydroxy-6-metoxy-1,4-benzoquinol methylase